MALTLCTCLVMTSMQASSVPYFWKNWWSACKYNMHVVFFGSTVALLLTCRKITLVRSVKDLLFVKTKTLSSSPGWLYGVFRSKGGLSGCLELFGCQKFSSSCGFLNTSSGSHLFNRFKVKDKDWFSGFFDRIWEAHGTWNQNRSITSSSSI